MDMANKNKIIGIIAFQGSVEEHLACFQSLGVKTKLIKNPADLSDITHLIIPGGESSVIGRFLESSGLSKEIKKKFNQNSLAIWGTCAGAILLGKKSSPYCLNLSDIECERNAYGSQINSFEAQLTTALPKCKNILGVFIRAPKIKQIGKAVKILAEFNNNPVLCQDGRILISTFHPELTNNNCIQEYFLNM